MSYNDRFPTPCPAPRSDQPHMRPLGPYVPAGPADTAIPFAALRRGLDLSSYLGVDLRQVDMREVDFFDPDNMRVLSQRGCNPLAAPFASGAIEHDQWYGWRTGF